MSPHRERRRIHICMKEPCSYCAARANAVHPPESVGGYSDLMTAVANELRRRRAHAGDGDEDDNGGNGRPSSRRRKRR